jgi:lipopolysaccharide transport system permease protein
VTTTTSSTGAADDTTAVVAGAPSGPPDGMRAPSDLHGPGQRRLHRHLFRVLVGRQLRLRSKRSLIGVAWPLVAPLFLLVLYGYLFSTVFSVPIDEYRIYLFAGLLPWTFFVQAVHDSLQSISQEADLVRRAPMPVHQLPLARVAVMAIPFAIQLVVFLGIVAAVGPGLDPTLLPLLVAPVVATVLLVAAAAMLLALIDVYNRDLRYVLNNLLTVWFFLTPIVYHERMTSGPLRAVTAVDPMSWVIGQFQDVIHAGAIDQPWTYLAVPLVAAGIFVGAWLLFRRWSVDLAKQV